MRLAILGPTHPYKGGVAQHTTDLARRLAAAGHDVRIESWSEQYPRRFYPGQQTVGEPEVPPFPNTGYPLSWRRPRSWWQLGVSLCGRVEVVVVVLVTPLQLPAYLVVLSALRRRCRHRGVPVPRVVVLAHNVVPHEARPVDRPLVRALFRRADGVLVHSEPERTEAVGLGAAPVAVRPLPPHLPGGEPAPGSVSADVDRPARHLVLFFGLVRRYKGLDVLIRALAAAPADVRLLVAGEFWGRPAEYRRLAETTGVAQRITWRPGYVPAREVAGLLRDADALVLPYRSATASQNVDLAFAHGLPVVVSRIGAIARSVQDGVNGLVVEPEDVAGLGAALGHLYRPGVLPRLRAGVLSTGRPSTWSGYLDTVLCLATGRPADAGR